MTNQERAEQLATELSKGIQRMWDNYRCADLAGDAPKLIVAALDAAEQRGESRRKDNTPKP